MNANTYASPAEAGGNREYLMDKLTILEPEDTPFTSLVSKGPAPKATFTEVLGDTLRKPIKTGSREGQDANKGNNKAVKRQRFGNYQHRVFDEYSVTDVQQDVSENGGVAAVEDEFAYAKAKTFREIKRDIEAACCSDQEMQGGSDAEMRTRGAFKWVESSAQSTNPVPSDFRTPSGAILSGVGSPAAFTENQLNGVLQALQRVYGGKRSYTGVFGDNIVAEIDEFTRVQPSSTNQRYYVTEMASKHEITMMVRRFETSFGSIDIMATQFNKVDSAGDPDHNAGLILNLDLWQLQFLEELFAKDEDDHGGGEFGWIRGKFASMCFSPRGNGKIYNT